MNDESIKAFLKIMNEVDESMRQEFVDIQKETVEHEKKFKEGMKKLEDLATQASVLSKFRKRFEDKFLGDDSQEVVIHHPAQVK